VFWKVGETFDKSGANFGDALEKLCFFGGVVIKVFMLKVDASETTREWEEEFGAEKLKSLDGTLGR
jgi:hypothetical protein